DAQQLALAVDDEQGADVVLEHDLNGGLNGRIGANRDGRLGPQNADLVLHEATLDAVLGHGPVDLRQVLLAMGAFLIAGQVVVTTVGTDHANSKTKVKSAKYKVRRTLHFSL